MKHRHGTQTLSWRSAKQKHRAKIFHRFKLENKASSRSATPDHSGCKFVDLGPLGILWASSTLRPFNNPGPKGLTRKHALPAHVSGMQSCNLSNKNLLAISRSAGNFLAAASLQHNLVWDPAHKRVRDVDDFPETSCLSLSIESSQFGYEKLNRKLWPSPGPGEASFHFSGPMHFPPSASQ